MTKIEWLDQEPLPTDVKKNPDGSLYIPIERVEELLDELTDKCWGTVNYHQSLYMDEEQRQCVYASIELELTIQDEDREINKVLVGSFNCRLDQYSPNPYWSGSVKSECVKNAAKDLGRRFGRYLNENFVPASNIPEEKPKSKPDKAIRNAYEKAIIEKDEEIVKKLESIYKF